MIGALLILAILVGLWAAWRGSVAACALLGSAGLTSALSLLGVPFDFGLWLLIDAGVIAVVERYGKVREGERAIFVLFLPAWVLYHLQPEGWRDLVAVIVALQFLLTVSWDRLGQRVWMEKAA